MKITYLNKAIIIELDEKEESAAKKAFTERLGKEGISFAANSDQIKIENPSEQTTNIIKNIEGILHFMQDETRKALFNVYNQGDLICKLIELPLTKAQFEAVYTACFEFPIDDLHEKLGVNVVSAFQALINPNEQAFKRYLAEGDPSLENSLKFLRDVLLSDHSKSKSALFSMLDLGGILGFDGLSKDIESIYTPQRGESALKFINGYFESHINLAKNIDLQFTKFANVDDYCKERSYEDVAQSYKTAITECQAKVGNESNGSFLKARYGQWLDKLLVAKIRMLTHFNKNEEALILCSEILSGNQKLNSGKEEDKLRMEILMKRSTLYTKMGQSKEAKQDLDAAHAVSEKYNQQFQAWKKQRAEASEVRKMEDEKSQQDQIAGDAEEAAKLQQKLQQEDDSMDFFGNRGFRGFMIPMNVDADVPAVHHHLDNGFFSLMEVLSLLRRNRRAHSPDGDAKANERDEPIVRYNRRLHNRRQYSNYMDASILDTKLENIDEVDEELQRGIAQSLVERSSPEASRKPVNDAKEIKNDVPKVAAVPSVPGISPAISNSRDRRSPVANNVVVDEKLEEVDEELQRGIAQSLVERSSPEASRKPANEAKDIKNDAPQVPAMHSVPNLSPATSYHRKKKSPVANDVKEVSLVVPEVPAMIPGVIPVPNLLPIADAKNAENIPDLEEIPAIDDPEERMLLEQARAMSLQPVSEPIVAQVVAQPQVAANDAQPLANIIAEREAQAHEREREAKAAQERAELERARVEREQFERALAESKREEDRRRAEREAQENARLEQEQINRALAESKKEEERLRAERAAQERARLAQAEIDRVLADSKREDDLRRAQKEAEEKAQKAELDRVLADSKKAEEARQREMARENEELARVLEMSLEDENVIPGEDDETLAKRLAANELAAAAKAKKEQEEKDRAFAEQLQNGKPAISNKPVVRNSSPVAHHAVADWKPNGDAKHVPNAQLLGESMQKALRPVDIEREKLIRDLIREGDVDPDLLRTLLEGAPSQRFSS